MRMRLGIFRVLRVVPLLALAFSTAVVRPAHAQQQPPAKEDPAKSLKTLQDQLEQMRLQRIELEARAEKTLSVEVADRAKKLAMGGEAGALTKLEFLLDSAQNRLTAQRDRIHALQDATSGNQQAALIVVALRADALPSGPVAATVRLDDREVATFTLTPQGRRNVTSGGAEQVHRGEIAPVGHAVSLKLTSAGGASTEQITIPAAPNLITYVEFVFKGGKLTATTWTSRPPSS